MLKTSWTLRVLGTRNEQKPQKKIRTKTQNLNFQVSELAICPGFHLQSSPFMQKKHSLKDEKCHVFFKCYIPENERMSPKKGPVQWEMHLNQPLIFRGHVSVHGSTPPKLQGWKLNTMVSKRNSLFQRDMFRFYVSFSEGTTKGFVLNPCYLKIKGV